MDDAFEILGISRQATLDEATTALLIERKRKRITLIRWRIWHLSFAHLPRSE
jgi:hypothetical protein